MRLFSLIIFLGIFGQGIAQEYSSWNLNMTAMTSTRNDNGVLMMHGLQLGRHMALGVYALAEHNTTNANDYEVGNFVGASQYDVWGLGIEKKLYVTENSQISFSGMFNYYNWHRVDYVNRVFDGNVLDRDESLEQYSSRTDFGFSLTMDYQVSFDNGLTLGPSVRYDSRMENVFLGLRAGAMLDRIASTETSPKNKLALYKAWTGGDGTDQFLMHGFLYDRLLTKRLFARVKVGVGNSGTNLGNLPFGGNFQTLFLESELVSESNEKENLRIENNTFRSLGISGGFSINSSKKASLNVLMGARYIEQNAMRWTSISSVPERLYKETVNEYKGFCPELGIEYNHDITNRIYLGSNANIVLDRFQLDLGVVLGIKF